MNSGVSALAVDGSGNLYAGGSFTTAGDIPANYIARWDGSAWSALGSGMNSGVLALVFDSSGNFKLREDVKWTALYDPVSRKAMLAWFPKVLAGQGHRTTYWDRTNYHKLYTQLYSGAFLAKGTKSEAALVVRGVEAAPEDWKQAVKATAAETQQKFSRGDIKF